jgi:hypothetical protein
MAHPLLLALFASRDAAMVAGREVQALGVPPRAISIVARTHHEEGLLAQDIGATPGAEIEDSRPAARVAELGGVVIAAAALIMPGIGPVVAAGPLSAELGEIAGHLAGGVDDILERMGMESAKAERWQKHIEQGWLLIGVHVVNGDLTLVEETLRLAGADDMDLLHWAGEVP